MATIHQTPEAISLIEAVHDLCEALGSDLCTAISEMINMQATGKLPPVTALVHGTPTKIDPGWWWGSVKIEYPNSSAIFNLSADGQPCGTRATEIHLDRGAWERRRVRIATARTDAGCAPPVTAAGKAQPTAPTATGPLAMILADLELHEALLQVCRAGRVHAKGKRIRYHWTPITEARWYVTTSVEKEYEPIPPEDWRDLMFSSWNEELRLEGASKWLDPDPVFEPAGWAFVRFSEGDLLDLIEDAQRRRKASESALQSGAPSAPERSPAANPLSDRKPSSRLKPFWFAAGKVARRWLDGNGCPVTGDGEQSKLESYIADWLAERSHHPAESTIRNHVRSWIDDYRDSSHPFSD